MVIKQEQKPENIFELRDALEIQGAEKAELYLQPINQLIILAIPKPERLVQKTVQLLLETRLSPENVL